MQQNLFHIGSLPYEGITQVRIHWLLDLIQMRINPDFNVQYNFTYLDQLIYQLWKNNLKLGFELMGNPSDYFTDFENVTQVYRWRDLIHSTVAHYIDLYGIEYIKEWNFETWNEPDHHDFDKLNFTIQGFLNYYDACSEGLKHASEKESLKFGGPGGSCRIPGKGHSPFCWALLEHCIRGRNFFTGKVGTHLDFISFHKKGNASTLEILNEEWETIEYIRNKKIPKNIPFYNENRAPTEMEKFCSMWKDPFWIDYYGKNSTCMADLRIIDRRSEICEADPMKNWAHPEQWRADVTYAAMVVKIILSHMELYYMKNKSRDIYFSLLSSDNAFLSYFPYQFLQRTLLARFQVNNTFPKYVDFIRKPVYIVFGLLSQLCPNSLHSQVYHKGHQVKNMNEFGVIATYCEHERNQIVLVMYNSADSVVSNVTFDIDLTINLPLAYEKVTDTRWVTVEINNYKTNPNLIWKKIGMPAYPTDEQFLLMKEKEEPHVNGPWSTEGSFQLKFHLQLLNPGVTMINVCRIRPLLKKVENVRFMQIKNNSLQISWTDNYNRCVLKYNVEYSVNRSGPYYQINKKKIVFPSYFYSCSKNESCSIKGFYRISSVDYWHKQGPPSIPARYSG